MIASPPPIFLFFGGRGRVAVTSCAMSCIGYTLSESCTKIIAANINILSLCLGCIHFLLMFLFHEVYEPLF